MYTTSRRSILLLILLLRKRRVTLSLEQVSQAMKLFFSSTLKSWNNYWCPRDPMISKDQTQTKLLLWRINTITILNKSMNNNTSFQDLEVWFTQTAK